MNLYFSGTDIKYYIREPYEFLVKKTTHWTYKAIKWAFAYSDIHRVSHELTWYSLPYTEEEYMIFIEKMKKKYDKKYAKNISKMMIPLK
jgi:hypothetical protein